ncbi:SET domain-containing protein 4-like [Physella acuta]|uniref:SET domain-containing protein 4-like n=1 Tax=Physella acuta TaxID=109671 RepID=UPI0027DE3620|nr:SET domain-containing protein 4-like [Physella acuta]
MKHLGRCGRHRHRQVKVEKQSLSLSHLCEFIRLIKWIKLSSQCRCTNFLKPACFKETGRGMMATRKINKGEVIVSVPYKILITAKSVLQSNLGLIIQRSKWSFTPYQLLTLFLVVEKIKGENSFWFPYISTLPDEYSTPLFFTPAEISFLTPQAKHLAEKYRQRFDIASQQMLDFLEMFCPSHFSLVSLDDLRLAWSAVATRSVYLLTESHPSIFLHPDESNVALAPFLDLLNHKDTAQVKAGMNKTSCCYQIRTENSCQKNDEVFICYGPHDNTKLFINYGFTLKQNIYNVFHFTIDDVKLCLSNVASWDKKVAIIKQCSLDENFICGSDGISWSLKVGLKIAVLEWKLLSSWKSLLQDIPLSEENEMSALELARKLFSCALAKVQEHLHIVLKQSDSPHFNILLSLAEQDVLLLESALKSLINSKVQYKDVAG